MTEPDRPLEPNDEAWIRAAFRQDIEPPEAKQAMLAALGVAAAGSALPSTKATALIWLKWTGVGAFTAVVGVIAQQAAVYHAAPHATPPREPPHATMAAKTNPAEVRGVLPESLSSALPSSVEPRHRPAGSAASAPVAIPEVPAGDVHEEVLAIERARRVLRAGDPDAALEILAAYDRMYPDGLLQQEARVLEVEAYAGKGERARALGLARAYLSAHPVGAHTRRIEKVVKSLEEP